MDTKVPLKRIRNSILCVGSKPALGNIVGALQEKDPSELGVYSVGLTLYNSCALLSFLLPSLKLVSKNAFQRYMTCLCSENGNFGPNYALINAHN